MRALIRLLAFVSTVAAVAWLCPERAGAVPSADDDADFVKAPWLLVAQAHSFTAAEARKERPIRIRGVITFVSEQGTALFIQDATDGIYVDSTARPSKGFKAGQLVEAQGYTAPGLFAPQLRLHRLIVLGSAPLPEPRKSTYQELAAGEADCQFVDLEGDVRWMGPERRPNGQLRILMRLASAGAVFPVRLEIGEPVSLENILDAKVRVRGVAGGIFNARRQMIGVVLYVARGRDVVVERPAAAVDPFSAPLTRINALLQYSRGSKLNQRVRIRGTVTLHHPGSYLYIWDGSGGVLIQTNQTGPILAVGDDVEAIGFPALGEWSPILEDASYRRAGTATPPAPITTTAAREASGRTHDSQLVTLDAELVDIIDSGEKRSLVLTAGNHLFNADLVDNSDAETGEAGPRADTDFAQRGSVLRLTGISVVRLGTVLRRPISFKLILRSPADIVVLTRAPWWTLTKLLWSLGALAAIFMIVIVWVVILRKRVRDQTETIRLQLQHESALEEQYRDLFENANDIIYSQDLDGRLTAINRAGEEITGYSRAEILTKSFFDLLVPERREETRRWLQRVAAGMEVASTFDSEIVAKDGRVVALEVSVRLIARDSKLAGFEGIARDVSARKRAEAELAAANHTLFEASRRAGMAEVASSVLHNVGNVLNTVNVSASLVAEGVKRSKIQGIAKVAELLRHHTSDMAAFLTTDPQGIQLPAYLASLAGHLGNEHATLLQEIETLSRSIDHIKEIVAMQQGYARTAGGVDETILAVGLIEDALRMHPEVMSSHKVELVKEYRAQPEVTIDKHKVLQILVNLISNARYACGVHTLSGGSEGKIIVTLDTVGSAHFCITVTDNGIGIESENLTRIFEHGFTTKKDGHGFGLHSAALTARQLGGTLSVQSAGPGHGAAFALELPLSAETGEKRASSLG